MIATALRGLLSRRLLSAGALLLAVIAFGSAMMGPIYERTATQSYRVATLAEEPASVTGVSVTYQPFWPGSGPMSVGSSTSEAVEQVEKALPAGFGPPRAMLVSQQEESPSLGPTGGVAQLLASDGACAHVRLVTGRCPAKAYEVILLAHDAATLHLHLGQRFAPYGDRRVLRLVGTYARSDGPDAASFWFDPARLASVPYVPPGPNGAGGHPYAPAPFITVSDSFGTTGRRWPWIVWVDRPLELPPSVTGLALARAAAEVRALQASTDAQAGGHPGAIAEVLGNELPALVDQVEQRSTVAAAAVGPAVVALVMVALVLLLRLLSATVDQRRAELALADLRGWSRGRLWLFGLLEPFLVIVAALPLGAGLGYAAGTALTRAWLIPGVPVPVPRASVLALAAVLVLALVVAAVALHGTLAETVASRLVPERRPGRVGRVGVVLLLLLVAITLAVLVLAAIRRRGQSPDLVDLVLPVLLAVVAGLGGGVVLRELARSLLDATGRRRGLVAFVAARTLARRREGMLVVLPLTAAVAIGIFSAALYTDAAQWRASAAATLVGADLSYPTRMPLDATVQLTHRIDPAGRYLMAAEAEYPTVGPSRFVVDTSRLGRVAVWPPQWTPGLDTDAIQRAFSTDRPPVVLAGRRLSVSLDNQTEGGDGTVALEANYVDAAGVTQHTILGPYAPHSRTTHARSLTGCAQGCTLASLAIGPLMPVPGGVTGVVTIDAFGMDGMPVPGALDRGWRTFVSGASPRLSGRSLVVTLTANPNAISAITPTDVPSVVPVLTGRTSTEDPKDGLSAPTATRSIATAEALPFVGPTGVMMDAAALSRGQPLVGDLTQVHILARRDTPAAMLDQLSSAGVGSPERLTAVRHQLDQDAFALVLRLYLVATGAVLLLALAGLAANIVVQLPGRRREAAALRVVGMRRRGVWLATAGELAAALVASAVAGLLAGFVAQYVVARTVTLGYADSLQTPRSLPDFGLADAALLAACVAVVLIAVAAGLAGLVTRGARGATLRESAR